MIGSGLGGVQTFNACLQRDAPSTLWVGRKEDAWGGGAGDGVVPELADILLNIHE